MLHATKRILIAGLALFPAILAAQGNGNGNGRGNNPLNCPPGVFMLFVGSGHPSVGVPRADQLGMGVGPSLTHVKSLVFVLNGAASPWSLQRGEGWIPCLLESKQERVCKFMTMVMGIPSNALVRLRSTVRELIVSQRPPCKKSNFQQFSPSAQLTLHADGA